MMEISQKETVAENSALCKMDGNALEDQMLSKNGHAREFINVETAFYKDLNNAIPQEILDAHSHVRSYLIVEIQKLTLN